MRKLLLVFGIMLGSLMTSCSSVENKNLGEYNRQQVAEVIASHDTTILCFMTSWCQAGQHNFERNLKPFLGNASDTKAIIVVCIGELEEVMSLKGIYDNVFLFNKASRQGFFDKIFINNECKKLLKDYKRVNYVPLDIACNSNGEILNWNTDDEWDLTYGSIYPYLVGLK